jgi:hypothetical protein
MGDVDCAVKGVNCNRIRGFGSGDGFDNAERSGVHDGDGVAEGVGHIDAIEVVGDGYALRQPGYGDGSDGPVAWPNAKYWMLYVNVGRGGKIFDSADQNRLLGNALL